MNKLESNNNAVLAAH